MTTGTYGEMSATVYEQSLIRYYVRPEHEYGRLDEVAWPGKSEAASEPHFFGPLQYA